MSEFTLDDLRIREPTPEERATEDQKKWALVEERWKERFWFAENRPDKRTEEPEEVYRLYLESPAWQRKRRQRLAIDKHRCASCGDPATEVHHVNYSTLGHESMDDLTSLCRSCHEAEHGRPR